MYHATDPDKPRILLLGPTGIAAININGTTVHSGLGIFTDGKLQKLSDKHKASLRNKLSDVRLIIIDEISMVSSDLFCKIHARLIEIFGCKSDEHFAGIPILVCGDLYQLPPVKGRPIFSVSDDSIQSLISYDLWRLFQLAELDEIMRQKDDFEFIELLNKIRVGNVDGIVESKLKARFMEKSDENYPHNSLHIFAENIPVNAHNRTFLENLPGQLHQIESIDDIPCNCTYPQEVIAAAQNRKQTDTGGLAKVLELKVGARIMLTVNIDIEDRLINGQVGQVSIY